VKCARANLPVLEAAGGIANLPSLGIQHVFPDHQGESHVRPGVRRYRQGQQRSQADHVRPRDHAQSPRAGPNATVLLDNFYTGGAISFDGHQWLMQGFVSDLRGASVTPRPRAGTPIIWPTLLVVAPTGFFLAGRAQAPVQSVSTVNAR